VKNKMLDITADYKKIFGSDQGERVLYDLMKNSFMITSTFSNDPHEMALREGHRNVILRILSILKTDERELQDILNRGLETDGQYRNTGEWLH
tara:strand:- start:609 stop:887 length:279 start_codon:yes stop_codon:yes gene_type:complete